MSCGRDDDHGSTSSNEGSNGEYAQTSEAVDAMDVSSIAPTADKPYIAVSAGGIRQPGTNKIVTDRERASASNHAVGTELTAGPEEDTSDEDIQFKNTVDAAGSRKGRHPSRDVESLQTFYGIAIRDQAGQATN